MKMKQFGAALVVCALFCSLAVAQEGQHSSLPPNTLPYDLILQGGHVVDAKNHVDGTRDVAIKDGKIAAVGEHLNPKDALKTIDVKGLWVTPGLFDIHVHVYAGTGE
ncbi:MAG: amidohydrolase/deacetylase family metallohydrolase, partial [Edaphobacter sp.]